MAVYDLILLRYPCRLVPKIPPTKIAAMVVGVKSGLVGERRRALRRWLSILVNHPILSLDPVLQVFVNYITKNSWPFKIQLKLYLLIIVFLSIRISFLTLELIVALI